MARTNMPIRVFNDQRGAVLVVGLIFLVVLTIIGVTAMQVTTMEERMAANARDRSKAFQAAEAGLRDAEDYMDVQITESAAALITKSVASNCANGFCGNSTAVPSLKTYSWDGSKDKLAGTSITGIAEQPRYFTEYAGEMKCVTHCESGGWVSVWRMTVRAQGSNADTVVLLQETYMRPK